jgi:hypothetical protein
MLSALTAWVEEGETPGPLVATLRPNRDGMPEELAGDTRLLCTWPAVAVIDNAADADRAENFRCQARE